MYDKVIIVTVTPWNNNILITKSKNEYTWKYQDNIKAEQRI